MYYDKKQSFPVPTHKTWDIIDPSKLRTYQSCPRQFFYRYVLGWDTVNKSNHLIFGSAWHKALEFLYSQKTWGVEEVMEAHKIFTTLYRESLDPDTDELYHPKTPTRALQALACYCAVNKNDLYELEVMTHDGELMLEIAGRISITDSYMMAYRMDSIMRKVSRGIISLEHKTGSNSWGWDNQWYLDPATFVYTHVLSCLYDINQVAGVEYNGVFFKKTKDDPKKDSNDPCRHFDFKRLPIYKTPSDLNNLLNTCAEWLSEIVRDYKNLADCRDTDSVLYAFKLNPTSCGNYGGCKYLDFCKCWANPLQYIEQVPMGFKVEFWDPTIDESRLKIDFVAEEALGSETEIYLQCQECGQLIRSENPGQNHCPFCQKDNLKRVEG